jgi:hypothetical protein
VRRGRNVEWPGGRRRVPRRPDGLATRRAAGSGVGGGAGRGDQAEAPPPSSRGSSTFLRSSRASAARCGVAEVARTRGRAWRHSVAEALSGCCGGEGRGGGGRSKTLPHVKSSVVSSLSAQQTKSKPNQPGRRQLQCSTFLHVV